MSVRSIYEVRRVKGCDPGGGVLVTFAFEADLADVDDEPFAEASEWAGAVLGDDEYDSIGETFSAAVVDGYFATEAEAMAAMVRFFERSPSTPSAEQPSPSSRG